MIILKPYQEDAVRRIYERFLEARDFYRLDISAADRETAREVSRVMLEAPTGAGKTLMAGAVAERFAASEAVVWFWFAPFKGLIEQSARFLRTQFRDLRVRDLRQDRDPGQTRSGDLFVTTWASVAVSNAEGRKVRQQHESLPGLDEFVPLLRQAGLRIGVIVDEAHHSFRRDTQAMQLFREVLAPDYTLLTTATPDEREMVQFAAGLGIGKAGRVVLTREQAVEMGLIKRGLKAVAYLAETSVERIVDYEKTALADGWQMHCAIRAELQRLGVKLTPLMLVQIQTGGKKDDEQRVKRKLLEIGVPEEAIAIHTAREPDPDVLAVAHDESKEVLIFKMKVALGFDAPRAFVLVSSRASRKVDFGLQVCGRILRVQRRLQERSDLPPLMDYGYVFLADAGSQEGLVEAARKVDSIRTGLDAAGSPAVVAVRIGERYTIQQVGLAGPSLLHGLEQEEPSGDNVARWLTGRQGGAGHVPQKPVEGEGVLPGLEGWASVATAPGGAGRSGRPGVQMATEEYRYRLRPEVPRFLKTHILPADYNGLAEEVVESFDFTDTMLLDGQRRLVDVLRRETELFSEETERSRFRAIISPREIERKALGYLFALDGPNPTVIRRGLLQKLAEAYHKRGVETDGREDGIQQALNQILTFYPQALRQAMKQCLIRYSPVEDTFDPLPEELVAVEPLQTSHYNAYGVMLPGLNSWERAFVEWLDRDLGNTVRWWHRNLPFRRDAVCLPLPSGRGYYPDFVVALAGRSRGGGILLVDTKERIYDPLAEEKVEAEHKFYGRPLMLTLSGQGDFVSVRYNAQTRRNETDRLAALDWMVLYE